jgi:hypothetical protein
MISQTRKCDYARNCITDLKTIAMKSRKKMCDQYPGISFSPRIAIARYIRFWLIEDSVAPRWRGRGVDPLERGRQPPRLLGLPVGWPWGWRTPGEVGCPQGPETPLIRSSVWEGIRGTVSRSDAMPGSSRAGSCLPRKSHPPPPFLPAAPPPISAPESSPGDQNPPEGVVARKQP